MKFLLIMLSIFISSWCFLADIPGQPEKSFTVKYPFQNDLTEQALLILQTKCNPCHAAKKKQAVFTKENINRFAKKINKQVFVKKRMPQGEEVKLSAEERLVLKKWVERQINEPGF